MTSFYSSLWLSNTPLCMHAILSVSIHWCGAPRLIP
jgi:hypothetical protein